MEAAIGAANWLLGKVLSKLSDELVAGYMASSELGNNFHNIKLQLLRTQSLLHTSQGRDLSNNHGLCGLLGELSKKADEAEDMLDELHYFMIKDKLDGTKEAAEDVGGGLQEHALHARHAARHTIGNYFRKDTISNWLTCFCCTCTQDNDSQVPAIPNNPRNATKSGSDNDGGPLDKMSLDRVAMSNNIKSVIEEMNSICGHVSESLTVANQAAPITLFRPATSSVLVAHDKFYGRKAIFEQTVTALTDTTYLGETLSVLPFVGPGGIGKTTFTQNLCNNEKIKGYFDVQVWVCVSTDFDVIKLTQQILGCILATEKKETNTAYGTTNLDQLQKSIVEKLKSKKFLIVLDDIWKCNGKREWETFLAPFTKGDTKGNMVLVTTRFPSIAQTVKAAADPVELHGLEANDFFTLFEACIFDHNKPPRNYEDELIDVGRSIAGKLKGSPLAANTVGRLLQKNFSREYWKGVLEKSEWKTTKNDDDIMPSLKISYDYLPFLLKKCFSLCALFPEDYKFYNSEITSIWTALGFSDSSLKNDKNYLEELFDNGFLMKGGDEFKQYYVMHDLFHELSQNVSSQECVNISSLTFSADDIPQSVQHLSITIENIYDESFVEEMGRLEIDIKNLRTLMIFGSYDARLANVLKNTFEKIKAIRVLLIPTNILESLQNSISKLIHLQYLKIIPPDNFGTTFLPSTLSRFYHLKFLELDRWRDSYELPKDISRLVNLRYFHSSKELHSSIPEVGKMKCLQELKEFYVKKESVGFELRELGEMRELGGELRICNLGAVESKEEASDAKLKNKKNLKQLTLVGHEGHLSLYDDILDGFEPHPDLRVLEIINPGVACCPSWLCGDIRTKSLESVHLQGVCWATLPNFERLQRLTRLTLKNVAGMRVFGPGFSGVTERSFMHLKTLEFVDMPELCEWVGEPHSSLFSTLESIKFAECLLLSSFPFLDCFTNLSSLVIHNCPELSQFPPMPHTSTLTRISVKENGREKLDYDKKRLTVNGYNGVLVFPNMDKVEVMRISDVSHISLSDLQKLNSLRELTVARCESMFSAELDDAVALHSVQDLNLQELCITGEVFSEVVRYLPALLKIKFIKCKNLILPLVEDGGGLWDLKMLQSFSTLSCEMFSRWPMGEVGGAHPIKPFPPSLRELDIFNDSSIKSMALFSNLTSLTRLQLESCEELTMDGFNPLITANLKVLAVHGPRNSIGEGLLSEVARAGLIRKGSFELETLELDSISAILVAPICNHLATTLHALTFRGDKEVETFTEEEEHALQLLTSLQYLSFVLCLDLESLPRGLHRLSSLGMLSISYCEGIKLMPPREGLPASLRRLHVERCSTELTEQALNLHDADTHSSNPISGK